MDRLIYLLWLRQNAFAGSCSVEVTFTEKSDWMTKAILVLLVCFGFLAIQWGKKK